MGQARQDGRGRAVREVGSPRAGRGSGTRQALVLASLDLFARQGVEATSVDEITAAADVAKGTFYVHFQRKQDVLLEWAAQLVDRLDDDLGHLGEGVGDAPATLRVLARALASRMAGGPRPLVGRTVREVVGNSADWVRVLGDRPTLWATILPVVERGQAEGSLRTDMSPLRLAMSLTILWLDGTIGWAERARARPLADSLDLATELFLGGAAAPDAPP